MPRAPRLFPSTLLNLPVLIEKFGRESARVVEGDEDEASVEAVRAV